MLIVSFHSLSMTALIHVKLRKKHACVGKEVQRNEKSMKKHRN